MKKFVGSLVLLTLMHAGSPVIAQDAKKEQQDKETYFIHFRELTSPERVFRKRAAELKTVLDAVASLKTMPNGHSKMDLWIARTGKDGKTQVLAIDWAGITEQGQTATNFVIMSGDRLFIQARFPK